MIISCPDSDHNEAILSHYESLAYPDDHKGESKVPRQIPVLEVEGPHESLAVASDVFIGMRSHGELSPSSDTDSATVDSSLISGTGTESASFDRELHLPINPTLTGGPIQASADLDSFDSKTTLSTHEDDLHR